MSLKTKFSLLYFLEVNPIPWAINFRGLELVIDLSSCLMLPAAAFRGFENLSFSSKELFKFKKSFFSKKTSPLISIDFG